MNVSPASVGLLETAVLEAVSHLSRSRAGWVRTDRVLQHLELTRGLGYAHPAMTDLSVPWRMHLPLLEPDGNWGSQGGDPPADPRYTRVRLSPSGTLALAAHRGELGPVPLALIEGSLYRGGPVPPFAPAAVVRALCEKTGDAGLPVMPTGGTLEGDLTGLLAGKAVRLQLGCTFRREPDALVITHVPLGVNTDSIAIMLAQRANWVAQRRPVGLAEPSPLPEQGPVLVTDVRDESDWQAGLRIVCVLPSGVNPDRAEDWVRSVWPVTTEVDCRLPAPQRRRLLSWDAGDGSGLAALAQLLTSSN